MTTARPMENNKSNGSIERYQKLAGLLIWVAVFGAYFIYKQSNGLTFADTFRQLISLLTSPIGPLVYIVIYALRPILFFPAVPLTVVGGAIFGLWGILWTVIGANISAMTAYGIGRFFGQGLIGGESDSGLVARYSQRMRDNSFNTVFLMRLAFLPYDLVNYLSGFLRINWLAFLTATALGSIAGTISFVLIGAATSIEEALEGNFTLDWKPIAISVVIFGISMIISRMVKSREATA